MDNYRGITVNSNVGKVYAKILRVEADARKRKLLGQMQHGFRWGWRGMDAVYILNHIMEKTEAGIWGEVP